MAPGPTEHFSGVGSFPLSRPVSPGRGGLRGSYPFEDRAPGGHPPPGGVWRWQAGARSHALSPASCVCPQAPSIAPPCHTPVQPTLGPRVGPHEASAAADASPEATCAQGVGTRPSPEVHKGCGKPQPAGHGAGSRRVWTGGYGRPLPAPRGVLAQARAVGWPSTENQRAGGARAPPPTRIPCAGRVSSTRALLLKLGRFEQTELMP